MWDWEVRTLFFLNYSADYLQVTAIFAIFVYVIGEDMTS